MTYDGNNSFVTNIVNNLNAVYASGGDKLLNVLIASNYTYDMKDLLYHLEVHHSVDIMGKMEEVKY